MANRSSSGQKHRRQPTSCSRSPDPSTGTSVLSAVAIANSVASGFLLGGILALTALGLSIVLGVMRLVNLAHGVFLIAGAYAGFFLLRATGIDPILALLPIGGLIALLAMPIQRFMLEPLSKYGLE